MSATDLPKTPGETELGSDALLAELDAQVAQALDHQRRLTREAEILQAKCEVAGEYRVKFMDLRDKIRKMIREANASILGGEPQSNETSGSNGDWSNGLQTIWATIRDEKGGENEP